MLFLVQRRLNSYTKKALYRKLYRALNLFYIELAIYNGTTINMNRLTRYIT